MNFYFSLQYSAIQAAVNRHDRLWSMAGMSQALSQLNEIILPEIATANRGETLLAGGGKFTARFSNETDAEKGGSEIIKTVSTAFPMLEFQHSDRPHAAATLEEALNPEIGIGLVAELNDQKRRFRGGGLSFNPHLSVCDECGVYPATVKNYFKKEKGWLCTYCDQAWRGAKIDVASILNKDDKTLTTIEMIYKKFFNAVKISSDIKIPNDFEDMVAVGKSHSEDGTNGGQRRRMAVWFSDINNMNEKVPIWIKQGEDQIISTFDKVKQVYIDITVRALIDTFDNPESEYLPFRIIVAGGDDLCIVMAEKYVLDFAVNLSTALKEGLKTVNIEPDHPLNHEWLKEKKAVYEQEQLGKENLDPPKPYSFGAAFVVTSTHAPFARIHQVGEDLMRDSKNNTDRQASSVNWRIMAEENAVSDNLLKFERPVFIDENTFIVDGKPWSRLTFQDYMKQCQDLDAISGSHRFQIVSKMIHWKGNAEELTRQLKILDSAETGKSFSRLFKPPFYEDGLLNSERIATVFELMGIERKNQK